MLHSHTLANRGHMPRGEKGIWVMVDAGPIRYVQWGHHVTTALEWESDQTHMAPDSAHR